MGHLKCIQLRWQVLDGPVEQFTQALHHPRALFGAHHLGAAQEATVGALDHIEFGDVQGGHLVQAWLREDLRHVFAPVVALTNFFKGQERFGVGARGIPVKIRERGGQMDLMELVRGGHASYCARKCPSKGVLKSTPRTGFS